MNNRNRVFTYITQSDQLLVFDHVDYPDAGIQVPGGTIEENENPQDAALREAEEETGIETYCDISLLANLSIDMRPFGKDEKLDAWFFHLRTNEKSGERWRHAETSPSGGGTEPIWFELYWVDLFSEVRLIAADGSQLDVLRAQVKKVS